MHLVVVPVSQVTVKRVGGGGYACPMQYLLGEQGKLVSWSTVNSVWQWRHLEWSRVHTHSTCVCCTQYTHADRQTDTHTHLYKSAALQGEYEVEKLGLNKSTIFCKYSLLHTHTHTHTHIREGGREGE